MTLPAPLLPPALVYAHRGGAALRPENTLAAFDHGLTLGADGLELDVHLSRDGVVVVHHDDTLDRTTDATGPIGARTAADLAGVDAGYRFAPTADVFPYRGQGWGVPTLRQVLSRYPVPLIIELKTPDPALARATVDEIRAARAVERVAVGSFYYRRCAKSAAWSRGSRPARRARRRGGRSTDRGCAGRSAAPPTASSRCPSDRAGPPS